ncbi:MAG: transglycosylase domain-containing protein [Lachnospiraceae bacterium]|nr:transglycosylase domain-containing protein [Lachnospiraceae bacterium]
MDYSKNSVLQKEKNVNSAKKKLTSKGKVTIFRFFIVFLFALVVAGTAAGFGVLNGILDATPEMDAGDVVPTGYSSTVYDANGAVIQKLVGSDANRIYVELDKIPKCVQDAFIAIEDERFWTHRGIDIRGIIRAAYMGLTSGDFDSGASTLTQQLIKNQVFNGGREIETIDKVKRKLQEQKLAIGLEKELSKKQILEYYLNTINLAHNTLGVEAASQRYFNKPVSRLSLSEAAVIAGITQSPAYYDPINYPQHNREKRKIVLDYMERQGLITAEEKEQALFDPVYERIASINKQYEANVSSTINSYFVDAMIDQLYEDLEAKGYTKTEAYNIIYRGGLSIYTTQDPELQKICDDACNDPDNFPSNSSYELTYALSLQHEDETQTHYNERHVLQFMKDEGLGSNLYFYTEDGADEIIEKFREATIKETDTVLGERKVMTIQPQISFTLMEQSTGEVKAIVGGRYPETKSASRTLNRATSSLRQPGSTFKVVAVYAAALDAGGLTLASTFDDSEHTYPNGRKVSNWETNRYRGLTTIREAIVRSMNVVTVRVMEYITPELSYAYLQRLGFTSIVESRNVNGKIYSDITLSTALGGLTDGVTNLELTAAYATIANHGYYNRPAFYTLVLDHDGNVLLKHEAEHRQVMKESTAWLLTDAMVDVVSGSGGTGHAAEMKGSMAQAGKTGTTSHVYDIWFAGFTPYYTAVIWSGYDHNIKQKDSNYHKVLWRRIMEKVHENLEVIREFEQPEGITTATVCRKCGKLATSKCSNFIGGSLAHREFFAAGTVPTDYCDCCVTLTICSETGMLATDLCPETKTVTVLDKDEDSYTEDTPYTLRSMKRKPCNVHVPGWVPPEEITTEEITSEEVTTEAPNDNSGN